MHGRHDDDHSSCPNGDRLHLPKPGHNRRENKSVTQWQTPHLKEDPQTAQANSEPDVDLMEIAFVRALATATDPTNLLRVAQM
jgi:hypothetical protein